jgi:3-deoxy-7-phosphoheptulonate synthase
MRQINNLRVLQMAPLVTPDELRAELPISERAAEKVATSREQIEAIISGRDRRLLVVVGPCSIHDPKAAREYAERIARLRVQYQDTLFICMRVYFEKPRSTVGWKGLINDPHLNGSCDLPFGLRLARQLLLDFTELDLPAGTEMLDPIMTQYIAELISWGAIGARTTESQTHREMASGLSMPIGFKNGTDGNLAAAINGMSAARQPHSFLGIDGLGRVSVVRTAGNPHCHMVLRGGSSGPNYSEDKIASVAAALANAGLCSRVMIDCSHANSNKDYREQPKVLRNVIAQLAAGSKHILGVMLESNLVGGRQELSPWSTNLVYGQSVTDGCIDFANTEILLQELAEVSSMR